MTEAGSFDNWNLELDCTVVRKWFFEKFKLKENKSLLWPAGWPAGGVCLSSLTNHYPSA